MPKSTRGQKTVFRPPGSDGQGEVAVQGAMVLQDSNGGGLSIVCANGQPTPFGGVKDCCKVVVKATRSNLEFWTQCSRCRNGQSLPSLLVAQVVTALYNNPFPDFLRLLEDPLQRALRLAFPIFDDLRNLFDWYFPVPNKLPVDPLTLLRYNTTALAPTLTPEGEKHSLLVPIIPNWPLEEVIRALRKLGITEIEGEELLEQDIGWPLEREKFVVVTLREGSSFSGGLPAGFWPKYDFLPGEDTLSLGAVETLFVTVAIRHWMKIHRDVSCWPPTAGPVITNKGFDGIGLVFHGMPRNSLKVVENAKEWFHRAGGLLPSQILQGKTLEPLPLPDFMQRLWGAEPVTEAPVTSS